MQTDFQNIENNNTLLTTIFIIIIFCILHCRERRMLFTFFSLCHVDFYVHTCILLVTYTVCENKLSHSFNGKLQFTLKRRL